MPTLLTNLKVHEVSFVPAPANKGAKILFFKAGGKDMWVSQDDVVAKLLGAWDGTSDFDAVALFPKLGVTKWQPAAGQLADFATDAAPVIAYLKREFTDEQRQSDEASGVAMPGGGYPIANASDLENAMRAIGRAKNPAKVKAHIRSRAAALGLTDKLSDAFKVGKFATAVTKALILIGLRKTDADGDDDGDKARDFEQVHDAIEAGEYADGMLSEIDEAVQALRTSVCEIMQDDGTPDKAAALEETFDQFKTHLQGVVPEWMEKAAKTLATGAARAQIGAASMDNAGIIKALGLDAKATEEQIVKAVGDMVLDSTFAKEVEKMSAKHSGFMNAAGAKMPTGGKKAFAAMAPGDRDKHMASNPLDDDSDDDDDLGKALQGLPEPVRKQIVADRERIAKLEGDAIHKAALETATGMKFIGKSEDVAKTLVDLRKASPALADAVVDLLKTANDRLAKSDLFKEHGSGQGGGSQGQGSAYEQINKLATEMVSKATGADRMTIEKARGIIRKAHPDLGEKENDETQERREKSARRRAA